MSAMKAAASAVLGLLVAGSIATAIGAQPAAERYDLLIKNARVLDGTGNPWFPADIAVSGGRIVAVRALPNAQAARTIDATGKYVSPGFIDIHSHADDGSGPRGGFRDPDPVRRSAPNLVSQGITTVVVNQDGRSPWPLADQRALLEKTGIGTNAMLLVGHGTVRRRVMGDDAPAGAAGRDHELRAPAAGLQEGAVVGVSRAWPLEHDRSGRAARAAGGERHHISHERMKAAIRSGHP